MIEVQQTSGEWITINPALIISMVSNKKRTVELDNGKSFEVNDYFKGTEFTLNMVGGTQIKLTKLGIDILRKQQTRGDFSSSWLSTLLSPGSY